MERPQKVVPWITVLTQGNEAELAGCPTTVLLPLTWDRVSTDLGQDIRQDRSSLGPRIVKWRKACQAGYEGEVNSYYVNHEKMFGLSVTALIQEARWWYSHRESRENDLGHCLELKNQTRAKNTEFKLWVTLMENQNKWTWLWHINQVAGIYRMCY